MNQARIETFEKMLQQNPEDRRLRYFLAMEYRKLDRHEEAVEHLRAYINAGPEDDVGAAWRDLGVCLEQLGRFEEARGAWQAGVKSARRHHHEELENEINGILEVS